MTKHYCDACRKELVTGEDERYTVRIETHRNGDAIELNEDDFDDQDDPDHLDAMDDLLSQPHDNEAENYNNSTQAIASTPAVGTQLFDLCGRCYQKYMVNPLGMERPQSGRYSSN